MKVAEAVAPVAARVDAVVAQPAGVAPGTDRVGVHAQDLRRTRHRQRRVERTRVQQVHLGQEAGSPGKIREVAAGAYLPPIFFQSLENTNGPFWASRGTRAWLFFPSPPLSRPPSGGRRRDSPRPP